MTTFKRRLLLLPFLLLLVPSNVLAAETAVPQWTVTSVSAPTNFAPGDESGDDVYKVTVTNTGGASSNGEPVTVTDVLPGGLTLDRAGAEGFAETPSVSAFGARVPLSCVLSTCTYAGTVIPDETLIVTIPVDVESGAPASVTNVVSVSGGGAPDASVSTPTTIGTQRAGFGIAPGSTSTALSTYQAGAHADLTTTIGFDTVSTEGKLAGAVKEIVDELPPGFGGDLVDTPTCPVAEFEVERCPIETQVGVTTLTFYGGANRDVDTEPIYNLAPEPGDVAKLGFPVASGSAHIQADVSVRPGDYGLQTRFQNINESSLELDSSSFTVWGVPTAAVHNAWRWNRQNPLGHGTHGEYGVSSTNPLVPYLASPTSCTSGPVDASISTRSWEEPEAEPAPSAVMPLGPFTGCDRLRLPSTFTAVPTTTSASAATGLDVELGVHQTNENAEGLATSALKKAVVTLPEGMTVNPSAGAGLGSCTRAEYEAETLETPEGQGCPVESKLGTVKIKTPAIDEEATGSVYLATPYANPFPEPARAGEPAHPEGSLIALYVVARFPVRGVVVKVAGKVEANPITGRLVTTFEGVPSLKGPSLEGLPPVPFSLFTFQFHQGQTSPLVTPPACGSYEVTAGLTPWSDPAGVLPEAFLTDISPSFEISSGANGGPCPSGGAPPFDPGVTAGTENNDAGSYSPLSIRISRQDGEQEITGFASQLPVGLTGNLTGIPFCGESEIQHARAQTGVEAETSPACPAASEIGYSVADAGVGSVLAQAPGKIYLGGPYEGAPFSVVAVTAAHVGPFDLGTVVIHFPLDINPETTQVTIPAGAADQIPHIIKGIVIHVREIRAFINRHDFMINPTNCNPSSFAATVIGGGADPTNPAGYDPVTVETPFRVTACQALKFTPTFTASTQGKTSKAGGASLTLKVTRASGPESEQANFAKVKIELPLQLPSRLTTLQKACTAAQFVANPAGCPAASVIGHVKVQTPIFPVPLEGPAYFVSHGGEAFPSLVFVLQGYGVTIDVTSTTFISKAGITSGTLKAVPDQPFTSFELTLPEGPYSALAANGNLCAATKTVTVKKKVTVKIHGHKKKVTRNVKQTKPTTLQIPTEFVAQNGAVIHQSTPVSVTSCPKAKVAKKPHKAKAKAKRKHTK